MNRNLSYIFLVVFLLGSGFICHKERPASPCEKCPINIPCTMEWRTIGINVTDTAGAPYALDQYRTKQLRTGVIFDLQIAEDAWSDSLHKAQGNYPVLTDSYIQTTSICGEEFEFLGYKNSELVVSEILNIRSNCCHIELVSGRTSVVLNP